MKRTYLAIGIIAVLGILVWGLSYVVRPKAPAANPSDEAAVRSVVTSFGEKLKLVPLLAPAAQAETAIRENYSPYVADNILSAWETNPKQALGRLTSSPWPDRIDIKTVTLDPDGSYNVQGDIVEMTSTGEAARYQIALLLKKIDGRWLITGIQAVLPHLGS